VRKFTILIVVSLVALAAAGCKRRVPENQVTTGPQASGRGPLQVDGTETADIVMGKVAETIEAQPYTYVRVDTGEEQFWAAAPACDLENGQRVGISQGMPMPNWYSRTLDREFELVYFVNAVLDEDGVPLGKPDPARLHQELADANAEASGAAAHSAGPTGVDVETLTAPEGGYTIAEVYAQQKELAGQRVKLRGKVVKYTPHILGKNWIHIQDGSGDAAQQTHDLTVTTTETAQVGDVVQVEGVLHLGKDFGAGYQYDAIVEDARIIVE
jgi:hypothetical protein